MTLVFSIDNGNSNPNVAVFNNGELTGVALMADFMARYPSAPPNADAIMADVGFPNRLTEMFGNRLIRLNAYRGDRAFLDMPVNYTITLGEDRLALAYHTYKTMPAALPALVVDSGTFTTIDVVDQKGFQGGYIFPGVRRFYEIYGSSARLPNLSNTNFTLNSAAQLPHSTEDAILNAGQIYWNGVFKEIKALCGKYLKSIVLTGGDALIIEPLLKSLFNKQAIVANVNLMHLSLYTVYKSIKEL